ncbi:MAG: MBOAT family O-acyltransferase [Bacteroidota bacterium]|nr:MBOAT family O-acyltransferase [Bacteroidota bacterium]
MLFNSITYFYFFTIAFVLYWFLLRKDFRWQNLFLFIASYCFYGWWDARFLILIFISSIVDFVLGRAIFYQAIKKKKLHLLWLCMFINLGMLGFFKYYNFFIDSFSTLSANLGFQPNLKTLQIILPVGISFYTFQSLSYSIDIYRGKIKPTNDFISFMTFVSFFPQLVAGPIERASHLLPQFLKARSFKYDQLVSGFRFILYGLFKKMVIADRLAYFVDHIYNSPEKYDGFVLLAATFMFGFQIYCDFSGYSDIAIGSARLLGFDLMQNFKTPYWSKSFKDFWHRWHISLSTWFRDYVYIPLGGNRVSQSRWTANILLTFTLSGLWHGASLTFIIWGFLHGFLLVSEYFVTKFISLTKRISWVGFVITFPVVNVIWVFFRADSLDQSLYILSSFKNLNLSFLSKALSLFFENNEFREASISILASFPLFFLIEILANKTDFNKLIRNKSKIMRWSVYLVLVFMILIFGVLNSAPEFIYFQF